MLSRVRTLVPKAPWWSLPLWQGHPANPRDQNFGEIFILWTRLKYLSTKESSLSTSSPIPDVELSWTSNHWLTWVHFLMLKTSIYPAFPAANPATPQWGLKFSVQRCFVLHTACGSKRIDVPWRHLNSQQRRKVICTEFMQGMNGGMRVWTERIRI